MDKQLYLQQIESTIAAGPWHDDWDSLATHPVPDWYVQKRLGIFLHWGVFSVPAYHDWYARCMYIKDSPEYNYHIEHYGPHKQFGWKDFIPMFKMEKFEPADWIRRFTDAGADYIVPVAEHHDGFMNYHSELTDWCASKMGPKRDILGDLLVEADRSGMTLGTSSHAIEHWFFLGHGREFDSDIQGEFPEGHIYWPSRPEPANHQDLYSEPMPDDVYLTDWLLRCCELVDRYHPRIFYFDWWIQHSAAKPYLKKFAAYYYNVMKDRGGCVINYKHDAFPFGTAIPDIERGGFSEAKPFLWQSDTSVMRNSWAYSEHPGAPVYKSPAEIIRTLADVVCKNGRLLLNFGPAADGTLSVKDCETLDAMAAWMRVNDECIHGTGIWRIQQEGPTGMTEGQFSDGAAIPYTAADYRFTCRGSSIYAICLNPKGDGKLTVHSLRDADASHLPVFNGIIDSVEALGIGPVNWQRDENGLHVSVGPVESEMPLVLKVRCK